MSNNFFKKLICLMLIAVLGISLNVSRVAASQELPDDSASTPAIFLQQAEALEAYSVLCSTFSVDSDGNVTYPDSYAGAWIEDNKLHIAITSSGTSDMFSLASSNNYISLLSDYDCVVYETAEYSLNELNDIRYSVFEELKEDYAIISHYVDVKENKINLGFLNYDETEVYDSLETIAIETRVLNNTLANYGAKYSDFSDLFILSVDELFDTEASLYGGMEINRGSSSGPGRSIGVCGTFTTTFKTTYDGIITAGHNLEINGTNSTLYRDGKEFGLVTVLMWKDYGNGDWACVQLTDFDKITNKIYGSSSKYTRNITGTLDDLPVGAAVMKYGFKSGYSEATVSAQDVTKTDSSGNRIKGLTSATLTSGTSDGGDSGGPYYTQGSAGGNNYNFVGVHWGSNVNSGGSSICFTPYVRFKSWFTVKTD